MLHKEYLVIFFLKKNEVLGAFKFWDASFSKKKNYSIHRLAYTLPKKNFGYYLAIRVF